MEKYKIIYGRNSMGCYCCLYFKFLWFFVKDTIWGTSSKEVSRAKQQAEEWRDQYSVPDNLVIRKDV